MSIYPPPVEITPTKITSPGPLLAAHTRACRNSIFVATLTCLLFFALMASAQKVQPDGNGGGGGGGGTQVVTLVSVSSSGSPSNEFSPVTFTVSVGPPTCGTNAWAYVYDNGTLIGTATLNSHGGGSVTTSSLSVGTHTITATFPGNVVGTLTCLAEPAKPPITQIVNSVAIDQGYINPKYIVVGVTYAPPGGSSSVNYSDTQSIGNSIKVSNSFQNDVGYSVSISGKVQIPAAFIIGGKVTLTLTESTDYTQGSNTTNESTINKENTVSYLTPGTPTFSPVAHDYDFVWIWVNPELLFNYIPNGNNPYVQMTGYAFDPHDPASGMPPPSGPYQSGPHIVEVQVGCLNGDWACPSTLTWLNGVEGPGSYIVTGPFVRSWASSADGYQYDYPTGEMPNLTFNDVCSILNFDPLASIPSQCPVQNNYTGFNGFPSTTPDGRFTKAPYPPNVIQYPVGGATEQYDVKQTNTQSVAQGTTSEIKQAFGVSEEFDTNFLGFWKSTINMKQSETLTWDYAWLDTLTQSTTLTQALSITGPSDPPPAYYGPVQFITYQDNEFGTYVFIPD